MPGKNSLIVGGAGALGRNVVNVFKNKGWRVMSMDLRPHDQADSNYLIDPHQKTSAQLDKIY